MILWNFFFYDFKYVPWPEKVTAIILFGYFLTVVFLLGWIALELLTYLAHL
jgi:hypothetical protein